MWHKVIHILRIRVAIYHIIIDIPKLRIDILQS
jgi:hypothetical protein